MGVGLKIEKCRVINKLTSLKDFSSLIFEGRSRKYGSMCMSRFDAVKTVKSNKKFPFSLGITSIKLYRVITFVLLKFYGLFTLRIPFHLYG